MPLELCLVDRSHLHRRKGCLTQLHLLLQGVAPGLEFPRPLLRRLTPPVNLSGLLDGPGTSLP